MKEEERGERLLRAFFRQAVADEDARPRNRDLEKLGPAGFERARLEPAAKRDSPLPASRPYAGKHPLRSVLGAAACLAVVLGSSRLTIGEPLQADGFAVLIEEIGREADERGLFIPLRALWPLEGDERTVADEGVGQ